MYKFFDKLIDKLLRLPRFAVFLILAPSFIYGSIFGSMQLASYTAFLIGLNINIYVAVIVFGLLHWLVFELIAALYFRIVRSMMNSVEVYKNKPAMMNILRWFFIAANIIKGSLRLCYFNYPLAVTLMENVLIFALDLAILIIYYFYIRRKYIAPQLYPRSIAAFCAPYLLFMALSMVFGFTGGLL